jgi:hypothetical protein
MSGTVGFRPVKARVGPAGLAATVEMGELVGPGVGMVAPGAAMKVMLWERTVRSAPIVAARA